MTLEELEHSISRLPPEDLAKFREWSWGFDPANWDKRFEADVSAGQFDSLAEAAIREHRAGESTEL